MYAIWLDDRERTKARVVKLPHLFWPHRAGKHLDNSLGDVADNGAGAALRQTWMGSSKAFPVVVRSLDAGEPPPRDWPIVPLASGSGDKVQVLQPPGTGPWFSCFNGCCTTGNLDGGQQ